MPIHNSYQRIYINRGHKTKYAVLEYVKRRMFCLFENIMIPIPVIALNWRYFPMKSLCGIKKAECNNIEASSTTNTTSIGAESIY